VKRIVVNVMNKDQIKDWHAHVYFDAASRDAAWALRERIE
jgi:DOPA 4,5-dioxygenase